MLQIHWSHIEKLRSEIFITYNIIINTIPNKKYMKQIEEAIPLFLNGLQGS